MPKRDVVRSAYRAVLANNLERLMAAHPPLRSSPKLEKASRVALSTINRLRREEDAAGIDTIDALAAAFGLRPWQLLVPGLDPHDPPQLARKVEPTTRPEVVTVKLSHEKRAARRPARKPKAVSVTG